jgi:hypothetical protein
VDLTTPLYHSVNGVLLEFSFGINPKVKGVIN